MIYNGSCVLQELEFTDDSIIIIMSQIKNIYIYIYVYIYMFICIYIYTYKCLPACDVPGVDLSDLLALCFFRLSSPSEQSQHLNSANIE